jgi:hypothetical protein
MFITAYHKVLDEVFDLILIPYDISDAFMVSQAGKISRSTLKTANASRYKE